MQLYMEVASEPWNVSDKRGYVAWQEWKSSVSRPNAESFPAQQRHVTCALDTTCSLWGHEIPWILYGDMNRIMEQPRRD